jgi:TPR repeat protein
MKSIRITPGSHPYPKSRQARLAKVSLWLAAGLCLLASSQVYASGATASQEISLLTHMAKSGDQDAQLQLALAYQQGLYGLRPEPETGIYWLKQSANGGQVYAADRLANAYASGQSVKQDLSKAEHWWKIAAAGDNADAEVRLGEQLEQTGNAQAGLHWLEKSADHGNPRAQEDLQQLYSENAAPREDLQRGVNLLNTLAEGLNLPTIPESLTWKTLQVGLTGEKSIDRLKQDARSGVPSAEYQLALHYRNGAWGVNRDTAKALYWLRHAAQDGNTVAMKTLAEAYRNGNMGLTPDSSHADKWDLQSREITSI